MSLTDDQLEQLEAYMDGELPAEQEGALLHRLASEPELAAAMTQLRREREARGAVWRACEPDDATVQRLMHKVEAAVDRHNVWAHRFARWRIPSAAAACILIGFLVGWAVRTGSPTGGNAIGGATLVADNTDRTFVPVPTQRNAPAPTLTTVSNTNTPGGAGAPTQQNQPTRVGPVELPIVNEYGQQVGVQRFNSIQDAARFVDDLNRWQQTQQKALSGNVTLTGVEKF
jgi:hypothetical protein